MWRGVVQAELCIYSSLKRLPVARTASLMLPDFLEFYGVRRSAAIRRGIAAAFLHTKRIAVASGSPRVTNRALYFTFNNDGYILSWSVVDELSHEKCYSFLIWYNGRSSILFYFVLAFHEWRNFIDLRFALNKLPSMLKEKVLQCDTMDWEIEYFIYTRFTVFEQSWRNFISDLLLSVNYLRQGVVYDFI